MTSIYFENAALLLKRLTFSFEQYQSINQFIIRMTLMYDTFEAYLRPLLKKHEAGQLIEWEDLQMSHTASCKVLELKNNTFISVRSREHTSWCES